MSAERRMDSMKMINSTMNIGAGNLAVRDFLRPNEEKQKNNGSKSVDASQFNEKFDPVEARLKSARKQAAKIIRDALAGELDMDGEVKKHNDRISELGVSINEEDGAIRKIDSELRELSKHYEGDEYQSRARDLLMERDVHTDNLKNARSEIRAENMTVRDMSIERLKTDPLGDAREDADAIMEAAGKDVVGLLVGEAQSHVDEELNKKKEEAERTEEEKKKLEEKTEAVKEREKIQEELKDMVNKLKLTDHDVKGAVVDEEA